MNKPNAPKTITVRQRELIQELAKRLEWPLDQPGLHLRTLNITQRSIEDFMDSGCSIGRASEVIQTMQGLL